MKEKINVLVLPSDKSGVGKFRSLDPHIMLQNLYPDDFHVDIDYEPRINDVNYWNKYHPSSDSLSGTTKRRPLKKPERKNHRSGKEEGHEKHSRFIRPGGQNRLPRA